MFLILLLSTKGNAEEKIKIGVSTALTGNAATYGTDIKNALLFASEKLAQGRYELLFEDDRCTGADAVSVAHKFVEVSKVRYVIGFACSGALLSAAPIYEKAKVVAISPGANAPAVSKAGDYIFRTTPSDAISAQVLLRYIHPRHKILGIISEETDYAQALAQEILKSNTSSELEIVTENFLTNASDVKPALLKLKSRNIDSLFINPQTEATFLLVLKQLKQLNFEVPVYGAYFPGSGAFLEQAGANAEGIVYADLPSLKEMVGAEGEKLYSEFEKKYGKPNAWDSLFVTSFEAFRALDLAIRSGHDVRTYLDEETFSGLVGKWSFDENGDINGIAHRLKVIRNGKATTL